MKIIDAGTPTPIWAALHEDQAEWRRAQALRRARNFLNHICGGPPPSPSLLEEVTKGGDAA